MHLLEIQIKILVIINTCLGLFHLTAIRTLAYDDPQCPRSPKLSALVFRLRLNRPHSWSPLPHMPGLLHSLSSFFCLSRPACITSALPTFQSNTYRQCQMPVGLVDYIICRMSSISGTKQRWEITTARQKGIHEQMEKPDSQGWSHNQKKEYIKSI